MAGHSASASPSPTLPLVILGLVLFMMMGPYWFMSLEPAVEETVTKGRTFTSTALEPLILIPALILIFVQFYGSYEGGIKLRVPTISLTDSVFALAGLVAVVVLLMWMRSSVKEMIQSL